jgi:outer membrane murein-binding lipoprotein Lpp
MKKIFLISFIIVQSSLLAGCDNEILRFKTNHTTIQEQAQDYRRDNGQLEMQALQKEVLRIQKNKKMSRKEKANAIDKLREQNKKLLQKQLDE